MEQRDDTEDDANVELREVFSSSTKPSSESSTSAVEADWWNAVSDAKARCSPPTTAMLLSTLEM